MLGSYFCPIWDLRRMEPKPVISSMTTSFLGASFLKGFLHMELFADILVSAHRELEED